MNKIESYLEIKRLEMENRIHELAKYLARERANTLDLKTTAEGKSVLSASYQYYHSLLLQFFTLSMQDTKKWYTSKTLWLNIIAIVVIALNTAKDVIPLTQEQMALVLALLNIINRFKTDTKISL